MSDVPSDTHKAILDALGSPGVDAQGGPPRPPLGQLSVVGDARWAPLLYNVTRNEAQNTWVLAHRIDRIRYQDYDRVRFYPTVIDGLNAIMLPIQRANFHMQCADRNLADLAMQELGPDIRELLRNLVKGGLEFGRQTVEKVWMAKTDIAVGSSQADGTPTSKVYPWVWTIDSFAPFDPQDTDLLIYPRSGKFAGIRQYISVNGALDRDIPADRLIHWAHNSEFNSNYGTPRTKASIPFVDLAMALYNDASIYFNRYAVPTLIGYAPLGSRDAGQNPDGSPVVKSNTTFLREQMSKIRNASSVVFDNEMLAGTDGKAAGRAWEITPMEIGERGMFVEYALHLNVMIGASLCVPQMALSTVPSSGTYNLGQSQIDLFTQNIEAILDQLADVVNKQLLDDFRIYNAGRDAPTLKCVFAPVSTDVARMFLEALVTNLSNGVPIYTPDGQQIIPDYSAIAQNYGAPVRVLTVQEQASIAKLQGALQQAAMGGAQMAAPPQGGPEGGGGPEGEPGQDAQPPGQPPGQPGGGAGHPTGGAIVDSQGDSEAAVGLPGSKGGMEGKAGGQDERARMGLSESEYRSVAERALMGYTGEQ